MEETELTFTKKRKYALLVLAGIIVLFYLVPLVLIEIGDSKFHDAAFLSMMHRTNANIDLNDIDQRLKDIQITKQITLLRNQEDQEID